MYDLRKRALRELMIPNCISKDSLGLLITNMYNFLIVGTDSYLQALIVWDFQKM